MDPNRPVVRASDKPSVLQKAMHSGLCRECDDGGHALQIPSIPYVAPLGVSGETPIDKLVNRRGANFCVLAINNAAKNDKQPTTKA